MKKLHMFIATSIDGYIAGENDDISWLSMVEQKGEDYGYNDFVSGIDTIVIGRKTYDKVKSMPGEFFYKGRTIFVISRTKKGFDGNVYFVNGVTELMEELDKKATNVFCDGGSEIIHELLQIRTFDTMTISIIPILLGKGVRLFEGENPRTLMRMLHTRTYPSGLVQLRYEPLESAEKE